MTETNPAVLEHKPVIGISACCFGSPVRYNGRKLDLLDEISREKWDYKWCPVCPEVCAGLGVPRDPIHLTGENGREVLHGNGKIVSRGGKDLTDVILAASYECLATLKRAGTKAFIYMDGSPSCGVYRTTLRKQSRGKPPGVFGALLEQNGFFLIPALDLQSPIRWWDWRRRMLAFVWLQQQTLHNLSDLFEIWHTLKFLCQEIDDKQARELGRFIAALKGFQENESLEKLRIDILNILRKPSSFQRIKGSLFKNYNYYRKITGNIIPEIQDQTTLRNATKLAEELILMERASYASGILFGTSPVSNRTFRRKSEKASNTFKTDKTPE